MLRNKRAAALLSALLILCPAFSGAEGDLYTGAAVTYATDTAEYGRIEMTMLGTVELSYPREADARYEGEAAATFVRFCVIRGDEVKQGDVLAVVQGNVSQAEVEQARLALLRAREACERQTQQNDEEIASRQKALNSAQDVQERARMQLELEKARLNAEMDALSAERNLHELTKAYERLANDDQLIQIVSAVDGVVKNTRDYTVGDVLGPGTVLATVSATADVLLNVSSRWGAPPYGSRVSARLGGGAQAQELGGTVVASDNMLSSTEKTGATYVRLDGGVSPQPGQQLTLYFPLFSMEHVLLVDQKAVHTEGGKSYVYLLRDGVRQKQYVTVAFANSADAWILDGLTAGDVVTLQ